jgi:TPR repeat protein
MHLTIKINTIMKRILILFISLFTLIPTFAQTQEEIKGWSKKGYDLITQGNYTEAVKWYRKAAEKGYADAQFSLGQCYRRGEGVPQDYAEAVKWYRKAAEQGDAGAQYNLGVCYANGQGVPQNKAVGIKWMKKAAQQGDEYAKNILEGLGETW